MVIYFCDRCGYTTNYKSHFNYHIQRKNICNCILNDIDISSIAKKYGLVYNKQENQKIENKDTKKLIETIYCEYCEKTFTKKYSLTRHYKRCKHLKQHNENNLLKKENCELKLKVIDLERKNHFTTNINSNNTIIINNYGKEDLSYLTNDEMTNYVKNLPPGVIKFIEKVHFNPQHPENSNLRITNKKDSLIQVRKKNKWIFEDKIDVITNLLSQKYQILEEHLSVLTDNDLTLKDKRVIDRFRNNYEENVKYVKDIIKRIELLILNNSKHKPTIDYINN